jgi:hypothetical protein
MKRGSAQKESSISIAIVVAIVLIASARLILYPNPEQIVAVSDDHLVRLEGVTRSSTAITIQRLDGIETPISPSVSSVYEISGETQSVLKNGELTFLFSEFDSDFLIQDVVVYWFDRETLSWIALPTLFDLSAQSVTTQLEFSGNALVTLGERVL